MPQSPKREVAAMHGVGVSHVMNPGLRDPVGVLTLRPPAPSHVPDSNQRARGWLPSPPATSSKPRLLVQSMSLFYFIFMILISTGPN